MDFSNLYIRFWMVVTNLGSSPVLSLITLSACSYYVLKKRYSCAKFLALSYLGGEAVVHLLKVILQRERPDFDQRLVAVATYSFPSGHAFLSMAVSASLILVLPRSVKSHAAIIGSLLFVPILVGISRLELRVHYPTDVVGGWVLGVLWTLACYNIFKKRIYEA